MAGFVSKDVIDRIRSAIDIVDYIGGCITVKRVGGGGALALCPFHKEKTPSFHINSTRQSFHCFGCGVGGDVFKFVMLYDGVDFPGALKLLAPRAGVELEFEDSATTTRKPGGPSKDELFKANADAAERYHAELLRSPAAAEARDYLQGRSIGQDLWEKWQIGYAPEAWHFLSEGLSETSKRFRVLDAAGLLSKNERGNFYDRFRNRVMFTIRDELGRVVGFSGRLLKPDEHGAGKYVNTSETDVFRKSRILFALDQARTAIQERRQALLVEGQIDCIRCHAAGFTHAVASQGTAFTDQHARLLRRYADQILIVLDADTAGRKAALRTAQLLLTEGLSVSLASLPQGEDPDSLILHQGADAFSDVLARAQSPVTFLLNHLGEQMDIREGVGLLQATRQAVDLASHAPSAVQAEQMLREASILLGASLPALLQDLRTAKRKQYRYPTAAEVTATAANAEAEAAAPPLPPSPPPPEELELAILLCNHGSPEMAAFVRHWIRYPLISHPDCRAIITALAEEEDLLPALDGESEFCQALAAQISNTPSRIVGTEDISTPQRAAQDLVLRIWQCHLKEKQRILQRRLTAAHGEESRAVLTEFSDCIKNLATLRRGWNAAIPVLSALLEQMDAV